MSSQLLIIYRLNIYILCFVFNSCLSDIGFDNELAVKYNKKKSKNLTYSFWILYLCELCLIASGPQNKYF